MNSEPVYLWLAGSRDYANELSMRKKKRIQESSSR